MNEPKVSVIIPVQNQADKIEQCLEAVFAQSYKPHEVIVVDGHSTDGTVKKARKFPVKIFDEDTYSIGRSRQMGVENAEGEYVAFTSGDCIPDRDWLANLISEFSPSIVGVGGGVKNVGRSFWEKSINLALGAFVGSAKSPQNRFFTNKRFVNTICAANSMSRREDILTVGGVNVNVPRAEDRELNKRLSRIGKLLYTPKAIVLHQHGWTLKSFAIKMHLYGRDRRMIRIWDLQVIPPLIVPLLFLSLIFTRWVFLAALGLYLAITIIMGIKFAFQEKDARYLFSIPLVYAVEHGSYTAGFWREVLWPHKKSKNPARLSG